MKKYTLAIVINVSQNWIDDGFDPTTKEWKEDIEEAITALMPYAYENEFIVTIKKVK
jgi:hypothetical protein